MHDRKIRLFDVVILIMIVASIAFYDIKILFLMSQLLAIIFAIPFAIKNKVTKKSLVAKYILWAVLFILYSLLSVLWASEENQTAISTVLSTIQVVLLSVAIIIYCGSGKNIIDRVLNYVVGSSTVLVVRFIATVPMAYWGNGERFSKDTIFGSNVPAVALAYASVILFWKIISNRKANKRKNIFRACMIVVFMLIALLMGTKKSILIFLIGSVVVLLVNSKHLVKALRNMAFVVIFVVGGYAIVQNVPLLYNSIGYRIKDFIQEASNDNTGNLDSTSMRKKFIEEALYIYPEKPLQGIGQDGFRYKNSYTKTYSHCNYVEVLVNLGLLGFLIYYSVYILIIQNIKKNRYRDLVWALIISMLFVDIGAVSYSMEIFYILFGVIIGALGEVGQGENKK